MRILSTVVLIPLIFVGAPDGHAQGLDAPRQKTASKDLASETLTNSLGMTLVAIPAGEFEMGLRDSFKELGDAYPMFKEPSSEKNRLPRVEALTDETLHKVRITRAFFMGAHEVTIAQFKRFVDEDGYRTEPERDGTGGYGIDMATKAWSTAREKRYTWRNAGFPQGDNHPVVNVTWGDAVAFCEWLSKKEARKYRLPTEAEWEYACRAGTTTRYFFGNDPAELSKYANTYDISSAKVFPDWSRWAIKSDDGFPFTAPVGSFKPNAFGLYDMHGNVWEWCSDWYAEDTYKTPPFDDPKGAESGHRRSRRGGGWHVWSLYCTSFYRNYNTPQSRYLNLGFRVVLEKSP
jgi:formylglycine-generating enzyme